MWIQTIVMATTPRTLLIVAIISALLFPGIQSPQWKSRREKRQQRKWAAGFPRKNECKLTFVKVKLDYAGCPSHEVTTVGCVGYCRSEATISPDGNAAIGIPKCFCCKPAKTWRFNAVFKCRSAKGGLKVAEILAAASCICSPCGLHLNIAPHSYATWHQRNSVTWWRYIRITTWPSFDIFESTKKSIIKKEMCVYSRTRKKERRHPIS